MDIESRKGNNPELLVDFNGHAVQCFPLGGETITVTTAGIFKPKTSLIRVANISADTAAFIKREGLEVADPGTPIKPLSAEMFSVIPGEIYSVVSGTVYITYIRNRDV